MSDAISKGQRNTCIGYLLYIYLVVHVIVISSLYIWTESNESALLVDNSESVSLGSGHYISERLKIVIYINIAVIFPHICDLLLDAMSLSRSLQARRIAILDFDFFERMMVTAITVIPDFLVLNYGNDLLLDFKFHTLYQIQSFGFLTVVLVTCNKLFPEYFTFLRVWFVDITFSLGSMCMLLGYPHVPDKYHMLHWAIVCALVLIAAAIMMLAIISALWILDVFVRTNKAKAKLKTKSTYALTYILSFFVFVVIIPIVIMSIYGLKLKLHGLENPFYHDDEMALFVLFSATSAFAGEFVIAQL